MVLLWLGLVWCLHGGRKVLDAADSRGAGVALLWDSCGAGVLVWLWGGFGVVLVCAGVVLVYFCGFGMVLVCVLVCCG